jgi:hypothetical protein
VRVRAIALNYRGLNVARDANPLAPKRSHAWSSAIA